MYWDLPPVEKGKVRASSASRSEEEAEDDDDNEEEPLIRSEELMGSYGSVGTPQPQKNHMSTSANAQINHITPPSCQESSEQPELSISSNNSVYQGQLWLMVWSMIVNSFILAK